MNKINEIKFRIEAECQLIEEQKAMIDDEYDDEIFGLNRELKAYQKVLSIIEEVEHDD